MFRFRTYLQLPGTLSILLLLLAYNTKTHASTSTCPSDFYQIPLTESASFCQLFADNLPATMSYHTSDSQLASKTFYISQLGQPEKEATEKGRIVLSYHQGSQTIIISADQQGSQIDILVK